MSALTDLAGNTLCSQSFIICNNLQDTMMCTLLFIVALVSLFFVDLSPAAKNKSSSKKRGRRNPSAISDEMYDALLIKLVKGEALPSVKERRRAKKSAFVPYWRSKGNIALQRENGKEVLYLKDRRNPANLGDQPGCHR